MEDLPQWVHVVIVGSVAGLVGFFVDKWKKTKGW